MARYLYTAAGFPAGVGAETTSFRYVRSRDDQPHPEPVAMPAVQ